MKFSIDKILIRVSGNYCVFDGLNADGSPDALPLTPLILHHISIHGIGLTGMNNPDRSGDIVLIMRDFTT